MVISFENPGSWVGGGLLWAPFREGARKLVLGVQFW